MESLIYVAVMQSTGDGAGGKMRNSPELSQLVYQAVVRWKGLRIQNFFATGGAPLSLPPQTGKRFSPSQSPPADGEEV